MSSTTRTDQATAGHAATHGVRTGRESSDPTAATAARTETEDKLRQALGANPFSTAVEVSSVAGIGRSTAAKILARWANEGIVTRTPGSPKAVGVLLTCGRSPIPMPPWSPRKPRIPSAPILTRMPRLQARVPR